MPCTLLLEDHVIDKKFFFFLSSDEINHSVHVWQANGESLSTILTKAGMDGFQDFSKAHPNQLKILLIGAITEFAQLSPEEQQDDNNQITATVRFVTSGLVRSLEIATGFNVEYIKIIRIDEQNVVFDMDAGVSVQLTEGQAPGIKKDPPFKVVVDNTHKPDNDA